MVRFLWALIQLSPKLSTWVFNYKSFDLITSTPILLLWVFELLQDRAINCIQTLLSQVHWLKSSNSNNNCLFNGHCSYSMQCPMRWMRLKCVPEKNGTILFKIAFSDCRYFASVAGCWLLINVVLCAWGKYCAKEWPVQFHSWLYYATQRKEFANTL